MNSKTPEKSIHGSDEICSAIYQRTEEIYQIPNSTTNEAGLFESPAIVLNDVIVLPHMVSPISFPWEEFISN